MPARRDRTRPPEGSRAPRRRSAPAWHRARRPRRLPAPAASRPACSARPPPTAALEAPCCCPRSTPHPCSLFRARFHLADDECRLRIERLHLSRQSRHSLLFASRPFRISSTWLRRVSDLAVSLGALTVRARAHGDRGGQCRASSLEARARRHVARASSPHAPTVAPAQKQSQTSPSLEPANALILRVF